MSRKAKDLIHLISNRLQTIMGAIELSYYDQADATIGEAIGLLQALKAEVLAYRRKRQN